MQRSHAAAWRGRRRGRGRPGVRKTKTNGGSEAYGYEVRGVCGRVLPARCLRGPPLCAAHREMTKTSLKPAEFGETRKPSSPARLGPSTRSSNRGLLSSPTLATSGPQVLGHARAVPQFIHPEIVAPACIVAPSVALLGLCERSICFRTPKCFVHS